MDLKKLLNTSDALGTNYRNKAAKTIEELSTEPDAEKLQKKMLQAAKIQDLSSEYIKLNAQLQNVLTAHEIAARVGFEG